MGASEFWTTASGATAKQAFSAAVEEARDEHGHGGYTGTIAEKTSYKVISVPNGEDPIKFARSICEAESKGYDDKWGPALCVQLGENKFLFFGLASS